MGTGGTGVVPNFNQVTFNLGTGELAIASDGPFLATPSHLEGPLQLLSGGRETDLAQCEKN